MTDFYPMAPVWSVSSDPAWNAPRPGATPTSPTAFLTPAQQARLERIRQARLLFDGRHRQYYLDEGRTQFDFPAVRVGRGVIQMYVAYNVLALISQKSADLLVGQLPLVRAEDARQQASLDAMVERCNLHQLLQSAALDCSYEAECFLESCDHLGEVYVRQLPAEQVFPVGDLRPDGQYAAYVRYETANVGTEREPDVLLLETTYAVGEIRRAVTRLDASGKRAGAVALDAWPNRPDDQAWAEAVPTGLAMNTVTWIPNLMVRGRPVSDYDGAIDLQDKINAANTQIARVLAKHSDPKLWLPRSAADPSGNTRSDYETFYGDDKARDMPAYVTWQSQVEAAMADRSFAVNALLIRTETSPVLLGLKEGAAPDAYKKVRLESFNSLTKAQRKSVYFAAGVRRALTVAQLLENSAAFAGKAGYAMASIGIQFRDGIPVDEKELADTQATLAMAQRQSLEGALEERLGDPAAVAKELQRINDDRAKAAAAATPSVFMTRPGAGEAGDQGGPVGGGAGGGEAA